MRSPGQGQRWGPSPAHPQPGGPERGDRLHVTGTCAGKQAWVDLGGRHRVAFWAGQAPGCVRHTEEGRAQRCQSWRLGGHLWPRELSFEEEEAAPWEVMGVRLQEGRGP